MRKIITALVLLTITLSLGASARIGVGGSLLSVSAYGYTAGKNNGVVRASSIAPAVTIDAEIVPIEEFAVIIKADAAPIWPKVKAKGELLPSLPDVVDRTTVTGSLAVGAGWQLPFSYWLYVDSPLEATVGGALVFDYIHLSYDTPSEAFSGSEFTLGAGLYESVSYYFGTVGFTLSSVQSLSFADFSVWKLNATGEARTADSAFIPTPVVFSWNISLSMSFRFGY